MKKIVYVVLLILCTLLISCGGAKQESDMDNSTVIERRDKMIAENAPKLQEQAAEEAEAEEAAAEAAKLADPEYIAKMALLQAPFEFHFNHELIVDRNHNPFNGDDSILQGEKIYQSETPFCISENNGKIYFMTNEFGPSANYEYYNGEQKDRSGRLIGILDTENEELDFFDTNDHFITAISQYYAYRLANGYSNSSNTTLFSSKGFLFYENVLKTFFTDSVDDIYNASINLSFMFDPNDQQLVEGFRCEPIANLGDYIVCAIDFEETIEDYILYESTYALYDMETNEFHPILNKSEEYFETISINSEIICNDNYMIITTERVEKDEMSHDWTYDFMTHNRNRYIHVVSLDTYETVYTFLLGRNSETNPQPIFADGKLLYLFDEEKSEISCLGAVSGMTSLTEARKSSHTITGLETDVFTKVRFKNQCTFIKYDHKNNCVYLKENYNFNHNYSEYPWYHFSFCRSIGTELIYYEERFDHEWKHYSAIDNRLEEVSVDDAVVRYIKLDLDDGSYEVLATRTISEIMEGREIEDNCIIKTKDFIFGDYIFTFKYDVDKTPLLRRTYDGTWFKIE